VVVYRAELTDVLVTGTVETKIGVAQVVSAGANSLKVALPVGVVDPPSRLRLAKICRPTEVLIDAWVYRRRFTEPAAPAGATCTTNGMRSNASVAVARPTRRPDRLLPSSSRVELLAMTLVDAVVPVDSSMPALSVGPRKFLESPEVRGAGGMLLPGP